jgi:hypothetical protein
MFFSFFNQLLIELFAVLAVMHPAMAVGTERNHVIRVVCSAVAPPVEVVDFQERFTVLVEKRRFLTAALADAVRNPPCVAFDDF